MKICRLSFANVNSLAGEWDIDFEHPSYSRGLFALTGPTGAGKTSVLDAICLALYGRTVRENVSKEGNEVMTRGEGKCRAEVTFETGGKRYRCRWSQTKARGKADGNLQPAEWEIAEAEGGLVLANQLRAVALKIEELTGMKFEQFTRAVLLAQGQFDAFLQAKTNERADILEKITDTGEFSKIGNAVFERNRAEAGKLAALEDELGHIAVLTGEDRGLLNGQVADGKTRRAATLAELDALEKQRAWLETLAKKEADLAGVEARWTQWTTRSEAARSELDRLALAETARKLDLELQAIEAARRVAVQTENDLTDRRSRAEVSTRQLAETTEALAKAAALSEAAERAEAEGLPQIADMRKLDGQIDGATKDVQVAGVTLEESRQRLEKEKVSQSKAQRAAAAAESERMAAQDYCQQNGGDAKIGDELASIGVAHAAWQASQRQADVEQAQAKDRAKKAEDASALVKASESEKKNAEETVERSDAALKTKHPALEAAQRERLIAEEANAKAEKEQEEKSPHLAEQLDLAERKFVLVRDVLSLEERRKTLADGVDCPLCGSKDHPYVRGKTPELSVADGERKGIQAEIARLEKAVAGSRKKQDATVKVLEKIQAEMERLVQDHNAAKQRLALAVQKVESAAGAEKSARQEAEAAMQRANAIGKDADEAWGRIAERLSLLGVPGTKPETWTAVEAKLKRRSADYEAQAKALDGAAAKIAAASIAVEESALRVQEAEAAWATMTAAFGEKTRIRDELAAVRKAAHGEKRPDEEEARLRKAREEAGKLRSLAANQRAKADEAVAQAVKELERAEKTLAGSRADLEKALAMGTAKWCAAGFADESSCRAARWTDPDVERVAALQKRLKSDEAEIQTQRETYGRLLAEERAKALTERVADEVKTEISSVQHRRDAEDAELRDWESQAITDDANRNRLASRGAALEAQKTVCARWQRLNEWIGTSGGMRFKQYAQGITLNLLLKTANPFLEGMTDGRYALRWDVKKEEDLQRYDSKKEDDLLPWMVDRHQADVIRPVSNLSGGERFMVSLALSLGLSGLAGGKLRVDSLFLDEGFGTLDSNALDRAIGVLGQLHQTHGKLIGVISHVEQMKNQIATKIEVSKVGGGRSRLSGPGVSEIKTEMSESKPTKKSKEKKRKSD